MRTMIGLVALALLLAGGVPAWAQQEPSLSMSYRNLTLSGDSARARTGRADVQHNDTLRYQLTFTNRESRALTRIVFDNPLPRGLVLLDGTVTSSARSQIEYSIDAGRTYTAQPRVVVVEEGRRVERPAPASSYTHIRWTLQESLAPGARATASFDMRVGANVQPNAASRTR